MTYSFCWYEDGQGKYFHFRTEDRDEAARMLWFFKMTRYADEKPRYWTLFLYGAKQYTVGYNAFGRIYHYENKQLIIDKA